MPASESAQISITVNGQARQVTAGSSVEQLLEELGVPRAGTAVELDGEILPSSMYPDTRLAEGQRLEIVRLVGGG